MQAAMLSPRFKVKEYNILEATPFGVSLSWDAPSTKPMEGDESDEEVNDSADVLLFPRNGETPSTKRLTFRRGEDFTIKASYADPAQLPDQVSPAIGAFTADVAVPALKYGADETTKAASAAASQVAVEASKVDWAGLAEGALEQTVVFLVYVPVFAYTFAASLPAEEQFVLGLVVILVVGSFAKQDD